MAVGPGASQGGGRVSRPPADPSGISTAIVLAVSPAEGGCAALLPWQGGTILGRLLGQLADFGIRDVRVITRPAWEAEVRAVAGQATLASADTAGDLRAIA